MGAKPKPPKPPGPVDAATAHRAGLDTPQERGWCVPCRRIGFIDVQGGMPSSRYVKCPRCLGSTIFPPPEELTKLHEAPYIPSVTLGPELFEPTAPATRDPSVTTDARGRGGALRGHRHGPSS